MPGIRETRRLPEGDPQRVGDPGDRRGSDDACGEGQEEREERRRRSEHVLARVEDEALARCEVLRVAERDEGVFEAEPGAELQERPEGE